jgi:hypothetical protein
VQRSAKLLCASLTSLPQCLLGAERTELFDLWKSKAVGCAICLSGPSFKTGWKDRRSSAVATATRHTCNMYYMLLH